MRRHILHPVLAALALLYLAAMVVSGAMPVQRQLVRFEAKGVLKLSPDEVTRVELSRGTRRVTQEGYRFPSMRAAGGSGSGI